VRVTTDIRRGDRLALLRKRDCGRKSSCVNSTFVGLWSTSSPVGWRQSPSRVESAQREL
jgi:hypothetical protein